MILREHIEEFGTAADGRLFRSATGGMVYDTTHTWAVARTLALAPEQVASPLAGDPTICVSRGLALAERRRRGHRGG